MRLRRSVTMFAILIAAIATMFFPFVKKTSVSAADIDDNPVMTPIARIYMLTYEDYLAGKYEYTYYNIFSNESLDNFYSGIDASRAYMAEHPNENPYTVFNGEGYDYDHITFGGYCTLEGGQFVEIDTQNPPEGFAHIYVVFEVEKYIVSFYDNYRLVTEESVEYMSTASIPEYSVEGHEIEWFDSSTGEPYNFSDPVVNDVSLYSRRESDECTVTIAERGYDPIITTYGSYIDAPAAPVKSNMTFRGWYVDEGLTVPFNENAAIEGDLTLYPLYSGKSTKAFDWGNEYVKLIVVGALVIIGGIIIFAKR